MSGVPLILLKRDVGDAAGDNRGAKDVNMNSINFFPHCYTIELY